MVRFRRKEHQSSVASTEKLFNTMFSGFRYSTPPPVYVYGSQDPTKVLNITGCQFISNYVTTEDEDSWGGGVAALGGEVNISNTVFWNNSGEAGYI